MDHEAAFRTVLKKLTPAATRAQFLQAVDVDDACALKLVLSIANWKAQTGSQKKTEGLKVNSF